MNNVRRGLQRSKKSLDNNEDLFTENEANKKIKSEEGSLHNLEIDNELDDENMDSLSSSDRNGNTGFGKGDFGNFDEFHSRGWSSTYKERSKGRLDNSLSVLTKKFIQLIKNSPNLTVDLNDAVQELNVQKRRIYDITNVLEGIGYIRKVLKNKIKWVGHMDNECELESLIIQEREITKWTTNLQEMLADFLTNQYSFVNLDDIKAINTLPKEGDQPYLVIRDPKDLLEIPNTESDGMDELPYKMTLKSEEIFICGLPNEPTEVPEQLI